MKIADLEYWNEQFNSKTKCDFCQRAVIRIARIIIHPVIQYNEEGEYMAVSGVVVAKKCWKCCEE